MPSTVQPHRSAWLAAATLMTLFTALGLFDSLARRPNSGLSAPDGRTIGTVQPESPAARAGFRVGDVILRHGDVDSSDLAALFRQPRGEIGESRTYRIQRAGEAEPLELSLTFEGQPASNRFLFVGAAAIGLAFLACGIHAYLTAPSRATRILAWLGVLAPTLFNPPPYLADPSARLALGSLLILPASAVPALLLHFGLAFPKPRPALDRLWVRALIYGPAVVLAALAAITFFARPQLLPIAAGLGAGIPLLHALGAIGALVYSYAKADRAIRARSALGSLLTGLAGAVAATVVGVAASTLPGASGYFLVFLLIPVLLSRSARRWERPAVSTPA